MTTEKRRMYYVAGGPYEWRVDREPWRNEAPDEIARTWTKTAAQKIARALNAYEKRRAR